MMSVCLYQAPRFVRQHLERHITLFSGLCDGKVADVILSIAAIMSTTSGLGKDIGIVLMAITLQLCPTVKLQLQSWPSQRSGSSSQTRTPRVACLPWPSSFPEHIKNPLQDGIVFLQRDVSLQAAALPLSLS